MRRASEREHPQLRCRVEEHLQASISGRLKSSWPGSIARSPIYRSIIIDVQALRHIDSTGLHILMRCHEALRRHGHRLAGSSPARTVERVVEIGGLWPMPSIYPDLRTAPVAFIDE